MGRIARKLKAKTTKKTQKARVGIVVDHYKAYSKKLQAMKAEDKDKNKQSGSKKSDNKKKPSRSPKIKRTVKKKKSE